MAVAVALQENNVIGAEPNNSIWIETSCRRRIPAHYEVLAAESPVLESLVNLQSRSGMSKPVIQILGVPYDAVLAFVTIICYKRDGECRALMDEFAIYLMVLAHAYQVRWLKSRCESELAARLTVASVVDLLQLAKQCDAQRLYFRCVKLMHKDFPSVEKTEGWIFLQNNDPLLELEILQFLHELDKRQKRRRRKLEDQRVYLQLSEAMDCLQHLCTDGCTDVCPYIDTDTPNRNKGSSCPSRKTCHALQLLFNHMASCRTNRVACPRCRRMWNLLRLHSYICNVSDQCSVPLCKQFKVKMEQKEAKADDGKWDLLAKRVVSIRAMSSLVKRKMHDMCYQSSAGLWL